MQNIFDTHYKKYDSWYDRNKFAYLSELEALMRVLPKKGKGLEIGVGTGRFAAALNVKTGIDLSVKMLKKAAQKGVRVSVAKAESLPFKNKTFDYAIIIISLCFMQNPGRVLEEVYRILKNKGQIIVGIIDKDSFLGKFYQGKQSLFYKHAKFFNIPGIEQILQNYGFSNFNYYQTIFDLPVKVAKVQKPLKGFGKGGFIVIQARK
ncbi:MAG: class I SAM-dependent methyltransferase [Candidatus Omnitrophota bacterium]